MKQELAEKITDQLIAQLEAGVVPWQRPWSVAGLMPTSGTTGKAYRGINTMLLSITQDVNGYKSPYWYTFNQAKKEGGNVKRGEKGTPIVFWSVLTKESAETPDTDKDSSFVVSRSYTVFNADQTEGFEPRSLPELVLEPPTEVLTKICSTYKNAPTITYAAQSRATYSPPLDRIQMPPFSSFDDGEAHLGTLFHELVHSTGHESRLNRFETTGLISEEYAEEELVAEIGAAMLLGLTNSTTRFKQSASYVQSWLSVLKNDRQMIVKAAQKAQKAIDMIQGTTVETQDA